MATKAKKPRETPVFDALDKIGTDAVVEMITNGLSYSKIAKKLGVATGTVYAWVAADDERRHACACARERAASSYDEQALDVIQSASDPFELAKAKEVAIHLRWRATAFNSKEYGDKQQITHEGRVELTLEQVEERIQRLAEKAAQRDAH